MLKKFQVTLLAAAVLGFGCTQTDQQTTQSSEYNQQAVVTPNTRGASTPPPLAASPEAPMSEESKFMGKMLQRTRQTLNVVQQGRERAKDPRVVDLADKMADDADRISRELDIWQQNWYPNQPRMTPAEADQKVDTNLLEGGGSFDARWLAAMIELHKETEQLIKNHQAHIQHPELKQLADNVVDQQQQEINKMNELLQDTP